MEPLPVYFEILMITDVTVPIMLLTNLAPFYIHQMNRVNSRNGCHDDSTINIVLELLLLFIINLSAVLCNKQNYTTSDLDPPSDCIKSILHSRYGSVKIVDCFFKQKYKKGK